MVWSDQSQFPFYVIDNNGNIILTIDSTGLHLDGTVGHIDAIVNAGQPTIFFYNPARTSSAFINAPILSGRATLALDSSQYPSGKYPGTTLVDLLWLGGGNIDLGPAIPGSNPQFLGGHLNLNDTISILGWVDNNLIYQSAIKLNDVSIDINGPNTLSGYTQLRLNTNGIFLGDASNANIKNQVQYLMSDGFLRLSSTVNPAGAWTNLSLQNGWTALAGYGPAQARLNPFGAVELKGTIRAGTITDNTNIFNLPWASLAPSVNRLLRPPIGPTGAGSASARLFVNSTVSVFCYGLPASTTDVGLDGLSFYL